MSDILQEVRAVLETAIPYDDLLALAQRLVQEVERLNGEREDAMEAFVSLSAKTEELREQRNQLRLEVDRLSQ